MRFTRTHITTRDLLWILHKLNLIPFEDILPRIADYI